MEKKIFSKFFPTDSFYYENCYYVCFAEHGNLSSCTNKHKFLMLISSHSMKIPENISTTTIKKTPKIRSPKNEIPDNIREMYANIYGHSMVSVHKCTETVTTTLEAHRLQGYDISEESIKRFACEKLIALRYENFFKKESIPREKVCLVPF